MSTRARNLLHKNKLDGFRAFLVERGWTIQPVVGEYEVLRATHPDTREPLLVYTKLGAKEHYTTHGVALKMARRYIKQRNEENI